MPRNSADRSARASTCGSRASALARNCSRRRRRALRGRRDRASPAALAAHEINRRAPLRAGLGQDQRAVRRSRTPPDRPCRESSRRRFQRNRPAIIRWMIEEEIAFELADEPLARDAARPGRSCRWRDRAVDRTSERGTDWRSESLERLAHDARPERMQVELMSGSSGNYWAMRSESQPVRRGIGCRSRNARSSGAGCRHRCE